MSRLSRNVSIITSPLYRDTIVIGIVIHTVSWEYTQLFSCDVFPLQLIEVMQK